MANIISTPVELTGEATKAAVKGTGHLARRAGEEVVRRIHPGYVPPEILAQQAVLRRFEGRLGVVGNLIEPDDSFEDGDEDNELEARTLSTAQALVDVGVVDEDSAVELRPVLPEDAILDPVANDRRRKVVRLLGHALAEEHGVTPVPFPDPIMPSERRDSPINLTATWGAISEVLSLLSNQLEDSQRRRPAMVAITGTPYSQAIREAQAGKSQRIDHYGLLVLQRVGTLPEDNLLVEAS
jgi:hypothetical protein